MSWAQVFANVGGQKAYRLAQAVRSGQGIIRISPDGSLIWIFQAPPSTLTDDGITLSAEKFLETAAELLQIKPDEVFKLSDNEIRSLARKITGIAEPQAPQFAQGDTDATH